MLDPVHKSIINTSNISNPDESFFLRAPHTKQQAEMFPHILSFIVLTYMCINIMTHTDILVENLYVSCRLQSHCTGNAVHSFNQPLRDTDIYLRSHDHCYISIQMLLFLLPNMCTTL